MKKCLALVLALVLVISMLPANVIAASSEEIADIAVSDTYVYDFMREEDGKFYGYTTNVAATYSDGSTDEMKLYLYSNTMTSCYFGDIECTDSQNEALWEVGNTYPVTYGDGRTFNVEVRQSPISRIEIDDCSFCGYRMDGDTPHYYYYPTYTVYYQDGSSETYNYDFTYEYLDDTFWTSLELTDSQEAEPWTLGQTYEVTGTLLGFSDTFNVTVVAVEDIQVEDVVRIEGDTHLAGYWDDNDNWVEDAWAEYDVSPEHMTLTLTDGSTVSGTPGDIEEAFNWFWVSHGSEQAYENQWGVGEHKAIVEFAGVTAEYNVIVQESPVKSFDIEDVEIMLGTGGYWDGDRYYYEIYDLNAQVTLEDGVQEITNYIEIDGKHYWINYDIWQLQQEQPWEVGGTYEVTGTLLGVSDTFTVTITPSPIKSIEIQDVELIKGGDGYTSEDVFYYYLPSLEATVTYADDSTEVIYGDVEINGGWYSITNNAWQLQQEQPWDIGTYEVTGTLLGISDTFTVTVTPSPISSIEIQDVELVQGGNGYISEDGFHYYLPSLDATVTYTDGSTEDISGSVVINDRWFNIESNADSLQWEQAWVAGGTYEVVGTLLDVSDTFNVTVVETPVASIVFEDLVLVEGIDSYNYGGDNNEYPIDLVLSEVILKDGTKAQILGDYEILYNGNYYYAEHNGWELQMEEPWVAGKTYQVTGTLLDVSDTFNVTIIKNPIKEIKLVKNPNKTQYMMGEAVNLKGAVLRIQYTDGTYEDVTINEDYTSSYYRSFYSNKLGRRSAIDIAGEPDEVGAGNVNVELFGNICQIPVVIQDKWMESIAIRENADKSITVTATNSDRTVMDMKVLDFAVMWEEEDNGYYVHLFTDKGQFPAILYTDGSTYSLAMGNFKTETVITSNTLPVGDWLEVAFRANFGTVIEDMYYFNCIQAETFDGKVTAYNIDDIVEIACESFGWDFDSASDGYVNGTEYYSVSGEDAKIAVSEIFALDDINLTLSSKYDAETDTFTTGDFLRAGGNMKYSPDKITYSGGQWTVEQGYEFGDGKVPIKLKMNSEKKITGFTLGNGKGSDNSVFSDINSTSWQFGAAEYAVQNSLMVGKGTNENGKINFDPNSPITREEFVQVLYNAEGKPAVSSDKNFPDVKNEWYKNAVLWAYEANIASGMGDGNFGVGKNITRQDLAVMLYKYAKMKDLDLTAPEGKIDAYADGSMVSDYAKTAMNWAVEHGVLSGKGNAGEDISTFHLDPAGTATRAECAAMLRNFMTAFGQ